MRRLCLQLIFGDGARESLDAFLVASRGRPQPPRFPPDPVTKVRKSRRGIGLATGQYGTPKKEVFGFNPATGLSNW